MNAILKKENVFVAIKSKDFRDDINLNEVGSLIYSSDSYYEKRRVGLYGGRVYLEYYTEHNLTITIDGIPIREIGYDKELPFTQIIITVFKATAFLNQIENLGIDSFLENYKSQLQEFKKDLEIQAEKIEQEQSVQYDENKSIFLSYLRKFIIELTCIIFCLLINMNAGLDNQFYTDAYNEILNLYF